MIHYRIYSFHEDDLTPKIYRSLKSVTKDFRSIGGEIYAYPNYKNAKLNNQNKLILRTDISGFILERPKLLTNENIIQFINNMQSSKRVNPHRCNASNRDYFRGLYDGLKLFGFDPMGRAINARIYFDISCSYNRTTSPIFINNQKSNKKGLLKYID